jgi:enoyl-CoA hydratase/carnithine racemase
VKNWLLRKKRSGVAFLFFDSPGKLNFLTRDVLCELEESLAQIESDDEIKAVVIISGKGDTFVAGADLHEILKYESEEQGANLSRYGNQVFSKLDALSKPTIAAINGICVGGGLELALCCYRRIATTSPFTVLGLPEVKHGLIPGLGGTQRLPRLIGVASAIESILAGDLFTASDAKALGIVQEVVSPDDLVRRAEEVAVEFTRLPFDRSKLAADQPPQEELQKLIGLWRRSVRLKTKGRIPAQTKVLDVIETGLINGFEAGIEAEITTFSQLAITDVARNLIFLFFTKDLATQQAFKTARSFQFPKESGLLILDATQRNDDAASIARLHDYASKLAPNTVLALVTSTNTIEELTAGVPNKENIIGLQIFYPKDKIKIVELIPHDSTSKWAQSVATRQILQLKKLPMIVRDTPGFLMNRIVSTYFQQAERLATSGIPVDWIEKSMVDFGMPMGPFAVLDEIGLERAAAIKSYLNAKLAARFSETSTLSSALAAGMLGRKSGCGTYLWQNDNRTELNPDLEK